LWSLLKFLNVIFGFLDIDLTKKRKLLKLGIFSKNLVPS
jgi:hypothetical protein